MAGPRLRLLLIGDYPLKDELIVGGVQAVTRTLAQALAAHEAVEQLTVLSFHQAAGVQATLTAGPHTPVRLPAAAWARSSC